MNLLFICSLNQVRSLTAEHIFQTLSNHTIRSAGTQSNARVVVNARLITWADTIFVMQKEHEEKMRAKFSKQLQHKKIVCLDIDDHYHYMDEELVTMLRASVNPYL